MLDRTEANDEKDGIAAKQGCSLGIERLGLEAVSRRFFGTSRLALEG